MVDFNDMFHTETLISGVQRKNGQLGKHVVIFVPQHTLRVSQRYFKESDMTELAGVLQIAA